MKKFVSILLICALLLYHVLAVSYASQVDWLEFLAWEKQDIKQLDTVEYTYNIMCNDTVLYTGSYEDCYHALPDFEDAYGDCFIMPV
jgi:hypothetical protein